jgi:SAM-dependent methyltransferase
MPSHRAEASSRVSRRNPNVRGQLVGVEHDITYGAAFADVYDEWYATDEELVAAVALLTRYQPKRVLELGVGTGRMALPLATALRDANPGSRVVGIDESPEMLSVLAEKDRGSLVDVIAGDMVDAQPAGPFDLVLLSYNTLFNLTDIKRQARCITNVAHRLSPGGRFVIEACVIDDAASRSGSSTMRRGGWTLVTESTFDPASGSLVSTTVSTHDDGRTVRRPTRITYSSPQRIDDMCRSASLTLETRYSSWQTTVFNDDAARHVSVYRNLR